MVQLTKKSPVFFYRGSSNLSAKRNPCSGDMGRSNTALVALRKLMFSGYVLRLKTKRLSVFESLY